MVKYAIAGNIACGKSTVEQILKEKGFAVLDTDEVSHKLLDENTKNLTDLFEGYDITQNGKISREKLARIIFSDKNAKNKLENFIHPLVKNEIIKFQNSTPKDTFVSVPLLFEAGLESLFDKIIFIYSDDEIRLKRLMDRNNYSVDYAKLRMASQLGQGGKAAKSDFVVHNNGTIDDLRRDILKIIL